MIIEILKKEYYISIRTVILFTGLLILLRFVSPGYAYQESDLQWTYGVSNTAHINDIITYNDYTLKVVGFPSPVESNRYSDSPSEPVDPFVEFNISKNGRFANNTILRNGETYITPDDELMIKITGLPSGNSTEWLYESYDPWVAVELDPRGKPELDLSIDTDKSEYSPSEDTEITTYLTLTNSGTADAVNVDLNIDTPLSLKNGSLKYHYDRVKKGDSIMRDITFIMPITTEDTIYDISANLSYYDVKNIPYISNSSKQISVVVNPKWSMSLQKTTLEKIYLKDSTMITLDLKNDGKVDIKNVSIEDSIPAGFRLVSNTSLHWIADIPAGGEWNYNYIIEPIEPNRGIVFPVATAEFKVNNELYGIRSNQPRMVVYGPLVTLNKKVVDTSSSNSGDTIIITVTAKNTGSAPTNIFITDQLPSNSALESGITTYDGFLEADKEANFSYTLKIDSLPNELPPVVAQYYALGNMGRKINISSQKVEIINKTSTNIKVTPIKPIEYKNNFTNPNVANIAIEGKTVTNVTKNISITKPEWSIFDFISKIVRAIMRIQ